VSDIIGRHPKDVDTPMYKSGMTWAKASQARTIDPRLWARSVNRGQVASSTRYLFFRKTKCKDAGSREIAKRALT